jgi:hypothetical protein
VTQRDVRKSPGQRDRRRRPEQLVSTMSTAGPHVVNQLECASRQSG